MVRPGDPRKWDHWHSWTSQRVMVSHFIIILFFNLGGSTELPLGPPEIDICENQTVVVCHPSYA